MEKNLLKDMKIEWVDIDKIKTDSENPNRMNKTEKEALRKNLETFGWNMPIITDLNYLIADGEQKLTVAKEMGLKTVPILKKKLSDTERRIIRQSMNKLRGTHNPELDADEFKRILEKSDMEDLTSLTGQSEQEIMNILNSAEKDEKLPEDTSENVERLGHLLITCPKCQHKFKKEDK